VLLLWQLNAARWLLLRLQQLWRNQWLQLIQPFIERQTAPAKAGAVCI